MNYQFSPDKQTDNEEQIDKNAKKITLNDLCTEDKARVGQLIKRLAELEQEKNEWKQNYLELQQNYQELFNKYEIQNQELVRQSKLLREEYEQSLKLLKTHEPNSKRDQRSLEKIKKQVIEQQEEQIQQQEKHEQMFQSQQKKSSEQTSKLIQLKKKQQQLMEQQKQLQMGIFNNDIQYSTEEISRSMNLEDINYINQDFLENINNNNTVQKDKNGNIEVGDQQNSDINNNNNNQHFLSQQNQQFQKFQNFNHQLSQRVEPQNLNFKVKDLIKEKNKRSQSITNAQQTEIQQGKLANKGQLQDLKKQIESFSKSLKKINFSGMKSQVQEKQKNTPEKEKSIKQQNLNNQLQQFNVNNNNSQEELFFSQNSDINQEKQQFESPNFKEISKNLEKAQQWIQKKKQEVEELSQRKLYNQQHSNSQSRTNSLRQQNQQGSSKDIKDKQSSQAYQQQQYQNSLNQQSQSQQNKNYDFQNKKSRSRSKSKSKSNTNSKSRSISGNKQSQKILKDINNKNVTQKSNLKKISNKKQKELSNLSQYQYQQNQEEQNQFLQQQQKSKYALNNSKILHSHKDSLLFNLENMNENQLLEYKNLLDEQLKQQYHIKPSNSVQKQNQQNQQTLKKQATDESFNQKIQEFIKIKERIEKSSSLKNGEKQNQQSVNSLNVYNATSQNNENFDQQNQSNHQLSQQYQMYLQSYNNSDQKPREVQNLQHIFQNNFIQQNNNNKDQNINAKQMSQFQKFQQNFSILNSQQQEQETFNEKQFNQIDFKNLENSYSQNFESSSGNFKNNFNNFDQNQNKSQYFTNINSVKSNSYQQKPEQKYDADYDENLFQIVDLLNDEDDILAQLEAQPSLLPNIKTRLIIYGDLRMEECDTMSQNIDGLCAKKNFLLVNQTPYQVHAVLGIQQIIDQQFLVIVKDCNVSTIINNRPIYAIEKIDFIPFTLIQQQNKNEFLEDCHYFSYEYKLTLSQQRISQNQEYYTKDFMWNYNLSKDFFNQQVSPKWICQMIQGYIGQSLTRYNLQDKEQFQFIIITRRSIFRSGTRCNHRGIDLDGYTANFVETEIMFIYDNLLISHTQIRGSAPILWEQKGIKQKIRVLGSQDISKEAFLKHFKLLNEMYKGKIVSITLMSDKKEGELIITNTMRKHYDDLIESGQLSKNQVEVLYYDLKKEMKGGKTQNINPYLEENIKNQFLASGYFMKNTETSQIMNIQKGIFRTNCKSSLDRTNLFQIKLGCFIIEQAIETIKNHNPSEKKKLIAYYDEYENALSLVDSNPSQYPFINEYKQHFSESGNAISKIYANTDALTEHVITKGNKFFGKLKAGFSSLKRLYSARFTDSEKHKAIDVILGNDFGSNNLNTGYNEIIQKHMKEAEQQYTVVKKLNIYAITWNIQAMNIENYAVDIQFKNMFQWGENLEAPDIICVSLQEMIEEQKNILHDSQRRKGWEQIIQNNLQNLPIKYVMVDCHDLSGILQIIYTKESLKEQIRKVEHDSLKLHKLKTKGAVIQRFEIMNTELCFVNTHLTSGANNESERFEDFEEIHKQSFQREGMSKFQRKRIEQNDFVILMGDLNFRVNQSYEIAFQQIEKLQELKYQLFNLQQQPDCDKQQIQQISKEYNSVFEAYLKLDEFKINKNKPFYNLYKEGNINFFPTYRYDIQQNYQFYDKNYKRPPILSQSVPENMKQNEENKQNSENKNQSDDNLESNYQEEKKLLDLQNQQIQNLKQKLNNINTHSTIQEEESSIQESGLGQQISDICEQICLEEQEKQDQNVDIQENFDDQNQKIQQMQEKLELNQQNIEQKLKQNAVEYEEINHSEEEE
ncbi:Endonuclease/exonuclease/phosphatase [Pseudocohnilembus persalinus]|uniref:phosphoinositide 5-phosphatase n=1 Tax=Pseudocohnilembus persalinus TaxID=266149 RepID=A0A0V0QX60_PSEPJ|nr:Endonuclease/exonuclease/phosphatase [Pseudocohnilembus persalinus]|eukprot:KRX06979.1 Endonuclease/exonuclease/phosphatase [Pseudocohnilembus persalinus]